MAFDVASKNEFWALLDALKGDFRGRDSKWVDRRKVRYRRMGRDLARLPLNPRIQDTALMVYQTELPNQEIHKRVKRLIANPPRFEVILFSDDARQQTLGQALEDGLKALYKWMNRGKVSYEWVSTEHQQGDGLGIGKLDFLPGHGSSLSGYDEEVIGEEVSDDDRKDIREAKRAFQETLAKIPEDRVGREAEAYDKATEEALRTELPPFRLTAVDPLSCYWWEDGDGIAVIAEKGKKSLNPLLQAFRSYGVRLTRDNRLVIEGEGTEAISGATVPDYVSSRDLGREVDYVEIRTRNQIAILIEHPKLDGVRGRPRKKEPGERGVVLTFHNPFGPHTTGYALIPGDVTTEQDPADRYQPPALGVLNMAQYTNVLTTARLSAALEEALSPPYIKVSPEVPLPPADEEKTPEATAGREIPMVPGEIKRVESPNADLDKADLRVMQEYEESKFQEALMGEATSDTSGHRLALQVAQADIQMVPYQNARKKALEELMKGVVYAVRKHGLTVYIPTLPEGSLRTEDKLRVSEPAYLSPEMADLNFELIITLGAETPVTKYAKWQAMALRHEQGTIGYQTLMEQSDVENVQDEISRVFEGKLFLETMKAILPLIAQAAITHAVQKFQQQVGTVPFGVPPETGLAGGGGGPVGPEDMVRLPGVNMPLAPGTSDFGPRVMEPGGEQITSGQT